jgi:hypothetical protein
LYLDGQFTHIGNSTQLNKLLIEHVLA